ncbi:MAG TPA: SDR family oxidoreductase [Ktedonobacteraceae bacterium]|nr:SDR family oxidoreductase [Ktedonobacteraceae bacterium]
MDINDSVVLVTGGARGLGKSLIQAFLDAGAKKIYVGSRTPIETVDPRLQPIQLDITNAHDIAAAVDQCQDVTILVNNAGVGPVTTFLTAPSLKEARDTMETNYFGTLAMARAFAPILKRNGGGTLVNILSVLSWFAAPHLGPYSASKAAELALTEAIRIELRSQGTQVVAVHIGYMDTDMAASVDDVKVSPRDVAASILDGLQNDQEEVLADQPSHNIKAVLAGNRQAFYQSLQRN